MTKSLIPLIALALAAGVANAGPLPKAGHVGPADATPAQAGLLPVSLPVNLPVASGAHGPAAFGDRVVHAPCLSGAIGMAADGALLTCVRGQMRSAAD
ncbi:MULTISPECIES: hypothetical protein [Cupriavidus]